MAVGCCGGAMSWPVASDWACKFCGIHSLLWALTHGEAHCTECHAVYDFGSADAPLTVPNCLIKEEYGKAWLAMPLPRKPMNEMSKEEWAEALARV